VNVRYEQWLSEKTIWHAGDLLSSAIVAGSEALYKDVAEFILENHSITPRTLINLAERVISPVSRLSANLLPDDPLAHDLPLDSRPVSYQTLHMLRLRLKDEPRNSIAWVDISRIYLALGHWDRAARAMRVAVSLSPDNRFVLRSAGRLYLHLDEPRRAVNLFRADPNLTLSDPWLMAAEISIAGAAELPSKFAKKAVSVAADDSFSQFARAELRSSLATLEMDNGKSRRARQLFRESLAEPNENSLAQVEWAERHLGGIQVDQEKFDTPRSFEARAYHFFNRERWDAALEDARLWLQDESFSSRPAIFASYVASSLLERYDIAEEILRGALSANPENPQIINNLAFALLSANKLEAARHCLRQVDIARTKQLYATTLLATSGLLLFREGKPDEGRALYKESSELATRIEAHKYRQFAAIYLAREEILAGTSFVESSIKSAQKEVGEHAEPDVRAVFRRLLELYERKKK
jgi:tetratricopeptide (TPR) repeat protein